jgi:TRAP-type mannitol/chloroaromatic compound transport system permease small subunit
MYHCDDFTKFYIKLENLCVLKKIYTYQEKLKSIEISWESLRNKREIWDFFWHIFFWYLALFIFIFISVPKRSAKYASHEETR